MKRNDLLVQICIAIGLVLYSIVFKQWVGVFCTAGFLLLTFLPTRLEIDGIGQIIFALIGLMGAYVFAVVIGPAPKHPFFQAFALIRSFICVFMLLYCCLRIFMSNPWAGHKLTILLCMFAVLLCGGSNIGWIYHISVGLFTIFGMWGIARNDPSRPSFPDSSTPRKRVFVAATVISCIVALWFSLSLPILYKWVSQRIVAAFTNMNETGFNRYFRLGSLNNLLKSNRVTLRVHSKYQQSIHLRGLVYNRYTSRHWHPLRNTYSTSIPSQKIDDVAKKPITVEYVSGESSRYFTPLHISDIATLDGKIRADNTGLIFPDINSQPEEISFRLDAKKTVKIEPPRKNDLQVPNYLKKAIDQLAKTWTHTKQNRSQKLFALRNRFIKDYKYSLSFTRPKDKEPLLDFLLKNKQGHCEYFASAFALLARSLGIPTRVVTGYLVSEYNELGQYYIVREKNAHAWAESWLPGKGWVTFDPTPPSALNEYMPMRTGSFSAITDLLRVWFNRFRRWVVNLTFLEISMVIGFFVMIWILIRVLRFFRTKNAAQIRLGPSYREVPPTFEEFMEQLQHHIQKEDSEPLEAYAERISQDEDFSANGQDAARIIMDYASLRYGQHGNPTELEQRMSQWLRENPHA